MRKAEKRLRAELKRQKKRVLQERREAYKEGYHKGSMSPLPVYILERERRGVKTMSAKVVYTYMCWDRTRGETRQKIEEALRDQAAVALFEQFKNAGLICYKTDTNIESGMIAPSMIGHDLAVIHCTASIDVVLPPRGEGEANGSYEA